MNERLENGICRWGGSVDGTSPAGEMLLARWGGAVVSWGNSPKIWLSFRACLNSLCLSLSWRSFVVGGSGTNIGDRIVLPRDEHGVLVDDNMEPRERRAQEVR